MIYTSLRKMIAREIRLRTRQKEMEGGGGRR